MLDKGASFFFLVFNLNVSNSLLLYHQLAGYTTTLAQARASSVQLICDLRLAVVLRRYGYLAVGGTRFLSLACHLLCHPICFSTCEFQKSQHLWFASQTLDLVAATHVPTTTRSTETIWGGIAEDTDQEFHAHEHTLHSLDLRVVSCKLLASGADSHYWVSVSPTLNVHRIQLALLGRWESPLQWWVSHLDSDLLHPSFYECAHHIERDGYSNALPFRQDGWMYHGLFKYSLH